MNLQCRYSFVFDLTQAQNPSYLHDLAATCVGQLKKCIDDFSGFRLFAVLADWVTAQRRVGELTLYTYPDESKSILVVSATCSPDVTASVLDLMALHPDRSRINCYQEDRNATTGCIGLRSLSYPGPEMPKALPLRDAILLGATSLNRVLNRAR